MKTNALLLSLLSLMVGRSTLDAAAGYDDRFVWVFGWSLQRDGDVTTLNGVLTNAARAGLNGAVFSVGLDSLCQKKSDYFERLKTVQATCEGLGLELIPSVFSVGYGGGTLGHNRNLAEGLPVRDALFLAGMDEARFVPQGELEVKNGGFEDFNGHRMKGFNFHDGPGQISFADTDIRHSGRASLRFENYGKDEHGHARVMQEIRVRPHQGYRVSLWIKTEGLQPTSAFQLQVLVGNRNLAPRSFRIEPTMDWRRLTMVFNSLTNEQVRLYAGLWQGKTGKFWVDDWSIEEVGPLNVLERAGTPVTVRNEAGTLTYLEGKDYAPLRDPKFSFWNIDRPWPSLRLPEGSRIREGDRLRVSWYHPMVIHDSQVTLCMAEPELEEIWNHEAELLAQHLHPRRILLNMDEVRMGGTCEACRGRNMGELLGECITRQVRLLRRHSPGARVYSWSDMLDPHHNAHGDYYLVEGDFTGSWNHVPKDLVIAVWGGAPRPKSLGFFSEEGFQTLVACYYDADDLKDVQGWLKLAKETRGVRGFMYTPWLRKYELLPAFGELVESK